MASTVSITEEHHNYFKICYIATNILPQSLRLLFKQLWDTRYQTEFGEWKNTPGNGLDFIEGESPYSQDKNEQHLKKMRNGKTAEWDCSVLFYAILFSDCIGTGLPSWFWSNVNKLRHFRNDVAHMTQGKLSEWGYRNAVCKVKDAFRALNLSTDAIQTICKQKGFPTKKQQQIMEDVEKIRQDIKNKEAELQISEEQRQVLEEQLLKEAVSFWVFPPKLCHPIATRNCEVVRVRQELSNLKNTKANSLSCCYISGNPGSGKSQMAGLVAKMFREEVVKDASALSFVMTLSGKSPEALMKSYVSLARKVKCPEYAIWNTELSKDMTTEEKINNLKDLIATKLHLYTSWLLVVDNVTSVANMCVYLPESGNEQWGKGQLLITTQDTSCIPPGSSHICISKGMELNDACCLLAMVSGFTDKDMEDKVTKALDYQPLAIAIAGTYMKKVRSTSPTFGWQNFLEKLQQGIAKRCEIENEIQAATNPKDVYPNSMTAVIDLAVGRVLDSDEVMKHAFSFLALCAPEPLRLDILANYILNVDKKQDKENIGIRIQGSSLLLMEKEQDCVHIRLHQVVYDIVKLRVQVCMETDKEVRAVDAAVKTFNQFMGEAMPESSDSVVESRHVVPHLKALAAKISNIFSTEEKKELFMSTIVDVSVCNNHLNELAIICRKHSEFFSGKEYLHAATKLIEGSEACGVDINTVDVAKTHHNLGHLERECGNHQLAKEHFECALSIQKKKLGPEHVKVACIYLNLGVLQYDCGNHQLAKEHYERALSIQQKKLGPKHVSVARTYRNLGVLHNDCGNHQQAKKHYERALFIQKEKLGPENVDVSGTYHNLGIVQSKLGNHQQAKEHYERALSIREKMLGPEHVDLASVCTSLGILHRDMGNNQLAKEHFERALSILKKRLGPEHFKAAVIYINLGILQSDCGNHQLAEELYERALSIQKKKLGSQHVAVACTYHNLGVLHRDMGNNQLAKEHYERALFIRKKKLGPEHIELARTYHNLGYLHRKMDNHELAKEHYERALSIAKKKLGPEHVIVVGIYRELCDVDRALDDNQQVWEQQDRALSIQLQKRELDDVDSTCTDHKKHRCEDSP